MLERLTKEDRHNALNCSLILIDRGMKEGKLSKREKEKWQYMRDVLELMLKEVDTCLTITVPDIAETFYPNGNIESRFTCQNDRSEGVWEYFWHANNGVLMYRKGFKDNKYHGLHEEFFPDGSPMYRTRYNYGIREYEECFDDNNNVIFFSLYNYEGNLLVRFDDMSTMIQSQSYDPETQELTVTFQSGHTYKYYSVSQDIANNFENASSMGQYFLQNIKHLPFVKEE